MDIFRVCRTCSSEIFGNSVSIYSYLNSNRNQTTINDLSMENTSIEDETQITSILDELTGSKYNYIEYPYPDKICDRCLNDIRIAYNFRQRCIDTFERLMTLSDANKADDEQMIDFKYVEDSKVTVENINFVDTDMIDIDVPDIKEVLTKPIIRPDVSKEKKTNNKPQTDQPNKPQTDQPRPHQCTMCDKSFTRSTHLKRHMTIHTDERAFGCKMCDKRFRRADHLKIHENYHAEIKAHYCEECQKPFSRAEHLRRHIANIHGDKTNTFHCTECEFVSSTAKELRNHRKSHKTYVFECKSCDQQFSTKSELSEHNKSHNDKSHNEKRPYLCSECGMSFVRNDYLVVHMRRHTGEKPFHCKFCERAFPRATDLAVHERYHTNERKFTCDQCGKGFNRSYNLLVHRRVHTGDKPYQCPHCEKRFSQNNDLKAHIRRHTGERFQCEICSASFLQIYLLSNHKKNVHGIDTKPHISRVFKLDPLGANASTSRDESFKQDDEIYCTEDQQL